MLRPRHSELRVVPEPRHYPPRTVAARDVIYIAHDQCCLISGFNVVAICHATRSQPTPCHCHHMCSLRDFGTVNLLEAMRCEIAS